MRWKMQNRAMALMGVLALVGGCDVPTTLLTTQPLHVRPATGHAASQVATIGGQDFFADETRSEMIPTSMFQARIDHEASGASVTCPSGSCTATYTATHLGMWHVSSQTFNWKITNGDNGGDLGHSAVVKTGGTGCESWLNFGVAAFCTNKNQNNVHTASATTTACKVDAETTTDHQAAYGFLGTLGISTGNFSVSSLAFGDNSKSETSPVGHYLDPSCSACDDPMTDLVEDCTQNPPSGSDGTLSGDSGTYQNDSFFDAITGTHTRTICDVIDWYKVFSGGRREFLNREIVTCWNEPY